MVESEGMLVNRDIHLRVHVNTIMLIQVQRVVRNVYDMLAFIGKGSKFKN